MSVLVSGKSRVTSAGNKDVWNKTTGSNLSHFYNTIQQVIILRIHREPVGILTTILSHDWRCLDVL